MSVAVNAGSRSEQLLRCLKKYESVKARNMLLSVSFVTLSDYLYKLRSAALALNVSGAHACLYLAAAVSDFYLPTHKMATHKIQSSEGVRSSFMTEFGCWLNVSLFCLFGC